ncbi:immunoglobulin-binding protein 1 family member C [Danaus plexippus]|uniref:Chilling-inducible protein n=1 Tax=Danaus plexippus plexippus TaxID=278856 RepID=A0A212F5L3_DANPL|nr:immunoglobulin-binding protein 1 family member C [Danaus plexippus]OWR49014.1 putative chilling-inducible protein [Danaus plexippus plexippus]
MAQGTSQSTDEESLNILFDNTMKIFDKIENGNEATNSEPVQMNIKLAISNFEKATNLVSISGMFSRNESLEELPTETLQYLLLPALLGTLSLKLCNQPRKDIVNVAEIYFRDFLQRCKDYGVTEVEVPQTSIKQNNNRPQTEQAKIANMVLTREEKIKRYKEKKELKAKLTTLSKAMSAPNADDHTKREYLTTLLLNYVNQALDELNSIEQEKPLLEYMNTHGRESKPSQRERAPPLKPVIITKDAIQKAVFGLGYPSLPTMTIEEFYDKRVRDGIFPDAANIPHSTIQSSNTDQDEAEEIRKEQLEETDDSDELERKRNLDEYKDDHRRGWGNRYNRS